jgi:Fe-S cluster biogenesis protein NfuA
MYEIYTQETPNPNAYLFRLATEPFSEYNLEFTRENHPSDNAFLTDLFGHRAITRVYICDNFLTIVQDGSAIWFEVAGYVRRAIMHHFSPDTIRELTDEAILTKYQVIPPNSENPFLNEWFSTKILPATEKDGGGMFLRDVVGDTLILQRVGACVTCPYVDITLEQGILKPLQNVLPNVQKITWA